MAATKQPAMSVEELNRFLAADFPQVFHAASGLSIEQVWHGGGRVRQAYQRTSPCTSACWHPSDRCRWR